MRAFRQKKTWVISDTHFHHDEILKFTDDKENPVRPGFLDSAEMDDVMLQNWNTNVRKGDTIYHLGDVFYRNREKFKKLAPKLNGKIKLTCGNHDDIEFLCGMRRFSRMEAMIRLPQYGLILSHMPVHPISLTYRDMELVNAHGHIHRHIVRTEDGQRDPRYINVCVEKTGYAPVEIDSLIEESRFLC